MRQVHAFASAACFGAAAYLTTTPIGAAPQLTVAILVLGLVATWLLCAAIFGEF